MFVRIDALHPSQQFSHHARTFSSVEPVLSYNDKVSKSTGFPMK